MPANPPGQHAPTLIAHHVVTDGCRGYLRELTDVRQLRGGERGVGHLPHMVRDPCRRAMAIAGASELTI